MTEPQRPEHAQHDPAQDQQNPWASYAQTQEQHAVPTNPGMPTAQYAPQHPAQPMNPAQPRLAGAGRRCGAFVIDLIVYGIILGIFTFVVLVSMAGLFPEDFYTKVFSMGLQAEFDEDAGTDDFRPTFGVMFFMALFSVILWYLLRVLLEARFGGSLGKLAVGIRVVNAQGGRPTLQQASVRNSWFVALVLIGMLPLSVIGMLGSLALWIALGVLISRSDSNQTPCDKWSETYIVTTR